MFIGQQYFLEKLKPRLEQIKLMKQMFKNIQLSFQVPRVNNTRSSSYTSISSRSIQLQMNLMGGSIPYNNQRNVELFRKKLLNELPAVKVSPLRAHSSFDKHNEDTNQIASAIETQRPCKAETRRKKVEAMKRAKLEMQNKLRVIQSSAVINEEQQEAMLQNREDEMKRVKGIQERLLLTSKNYYRRTGLIKSEVFQQHPQPMAQIQMRDTGMFEFKLYTLHAMRDKLIERRDKDNDKYLFSRLYSADKHTYNIKQLDQRGQLLNTSQEQKQLLNNSQEINTRKQKYLFRPLKEQSNQSICWTPNQAKLRGLLDECERTSRNISFLSNRVDRSMEIKNYKYDSLKNQVISTAEKTFIDKQMIEFYH